MKFIKSFARVACIGLVLGLGACSDDDGDDSNVLHGLTADPAYQTREVAAQHTYIPALFYANVDSADAAAVENAVRALETYRKDWELYRDAYRNLSYYAGWGEYFDRVDSRIDTAAQALADARTLVARPDAETADLSLAYEALESVRTTLKEMRETNGLSDWMDTLTTFHQGLAPLGQALAGVATAAGVAPEVVASFVGSLTTLEAAWQTFTTTTVDYARYGFNAAKTEYIDQAIAAQSDNLKQFAGALANFDKSEILTSAQQVQPLFDKMFLAFGDFIAPVEEQMAAMEQEYIPALLYTDNPAASAEVLDNARTHFARFDASWQVFSLPLGGVASLLGWQPHFDEIRQSIDEARTVLDGAGTPPQDLAPAHEALQNVRKTLAEWRTGLGDYPFVMDNLTAYQDVMEPIAMLTAGLTDSGEMSAEQSAELAALLSPLQDAMTAMTTAVADMSAETFNFGAEKIQELQAKLDAQQNNLDVLDQALQSDDDAAALAAAQQVKPLFVEFFKSFGAF